MFYAFIWVKRGNKEFVWVRDRITEADFRLSALFPPEPTGSVSMDLVEALLRNSNLGKTKKQANTFFRFLSVLYCFTESVPGT